MEALKKKKILIIDDAQPVCDFVSAIFSHEGAKMLVANDGKQGLRQFYSQQPDLVLLDLRMPGMSGLETLKRIRELSNVPIIMLSFVDAQDDIILCLMAGADDYVTKPYNPQVLMARALAALRRTVGSIEAPKAPKYDDGHLMFDLEARIVKVDGKDVQLSATEYALLDYLILNAGHTCTFAQIFDNVWGGQGLSSEENVHTFVYQLRRKIEQDPSTPIYLISFRGVGYRFQHAISD